MKIISKTEATKHASSCFIYIITFPNNFNFYEMNSRHNISFISNDGEKVETVSDFTFWGSKITADGDCSHEIKRRLLLETRHLLLETKAMTNLDSILKSRDVTLSTKVHLVKPMVFPVVMYGCERWTIKKAGMQIMKQQLELDMEQQTGCK